MKNESKTLEQITRFVDEEREIEYVKILSAYVEINFYNLLDRSLDNYNFYRRKRFNIKQSKIKALFDVNVYASSNYKLNHKEEIENE